MKKILLLGIIAFAAALWSCESSTEIAMEYQLKANVSSSTVVKNMKTASGDNYFTSDDNLELTLRSYIYDSNGDLVENKSVTLSNFYDNATFSSSLTQGSYTVVYAVCINDTNGSAIWSVSNTSSLYNISFSVRDGWNEWAHVLGVSMQTIEVLGSKEISVDIESVGSFISLAFTYGDDSNASYLYVAGDKQNVSYSVYDQESSSYTAPEGYEAWGDEAYLSPDYAGTLLNYFFLPTDGINITWKSLDSSLNIINSGSLNCDLIEGSNYTITTNIDSGVTTKSAEVEMFSPDVKLLNK